MQHTSWTDGLEPMADGDRLIGLAGVVPLRLLAERTGLRNLMGATGSAVGQAWCW